MTAHSGSFCLKSVKLRKVEAEISLTEGFDFGEALYQVYPLLDIIFSYLPLNDVNSCLKVCPSWKEKAEQALSRRTDPSWVTCYKMTSKSRKKANLANIISHSANLNFSNVALGIILYDNCRMQLNKYICLHTNIVELSRKPVPEYVEEELVPKSVDYCMLSVPRVVSCFSSGRVSRDVQFHSSIFDGVFIPKIPSMRTVMFHCNPSKKNEIEKAVKFHIKSNEVTKCLLLFCKAQLHENLYNFLEYLVPAGRPSTVALGGGVIKGTKTFQKMGLDKNLYTVKDTVCVVFLKDKYAQDDNFKAYSCVINGDELTKQEFNTELEYFKENIVLKQHSMGFRICCNVKCQDTEVQSFQEVFPGLPVLGLGAYGEIGWNCYPNASVESETPKAKRVKQSDNYPSAENYFSTIFVLLTWD